MRKRFIFSWNWILPLIFLQVQMHQLNFHWNHLRMICLDKQNWFYIWDIWRQKIIKIKIRFDPIHTYKVDGIKSLNLFYLFKACFYLCRAAYRLKGLRFLDLCLVDTNQWILSVISRGSLSSLKSFGLIVNAQLNLKSNK